MKAMRLENKLAEAEGLATQRLGTHSFRKAWSGGSEEGRMRELAGSVNPTGI